LIILGGIKLTNINKPITVVREEFIHDLVNLINNTSLPLFVIESALKDCMLEVHQGAQQQLHTDKMMYEKQLDIESQKDVKK